MLQAIIDKYDQFCDCLKFSSSKHLSWVHCTWTMPQYATMAFSFAVAFSFPVARNGSIRFELTRNENIGPSLRQALQFIEEIMGKCNATEIQGPHIWFHVIGWHRLAWFRSFRYSERTSVYEFSATRMGQPKGRMNRHWQHSIKCFQHILMPRFQSIWSLKCTPAALWWNICQQLQFRLGQVSWADAIAVSGAAVLPYLLQQSF